MSNWSDIRNAFIEWAKINDQEYDESIKHSRYALMRSDAFKTFIVEYDDDYNMDSFTSSRKDIDDNRTKDEDKRENSLIEDMAHDYASDLDKDSDAFKALDTDGNGKLSTKEKEAFIDKVIEAGFDENKDDLSYADLQSAAQKIESGDIEFLKGTDGVGGTGGTGGTGGAGGAGGTGGADRTGDTDGTDGADGVDGKGDGSGLGDDAPEVTNEDLISLDLTDYEPQVARNSSDFSTANLSKVKNFEFSQDYSNASLSELVSTRDSVESAIGEAQANFGLYKTQYTNANATMMQAENFITANEAAYNNVLESAIANNENIRILNDQITTHENTIAQSTELVNSLGATKDSLNANLGAIQGSIAGLRGQCTVAKTVNEYNSDGSIVIGTKTIYEVDEALYNQRLAALKQQEERIKQELQEVANQLLEQEQIINETNEQLQQAYTNLNEQLSLTGFFEGEQGELARAVVQNKQVYSQARADMASAQAGMSAMDAHIVALAAECDDIEEAIEEAKAREAQEAREAEDEEKAKEIEATEAGKYATGEAEKSDFTDANGNSLDFLGSEQIPEEATLKDMEFDENGKLLGYTIEVEGYTISANIDESGNVTYSRDLGEGYLDETLTLGADGSVDFDLNGIENYYNQNADGSYSTQRPILDDAGNVIGQVSVTSKKDANGNQQLEYIKTDSEGKVVQHQTRTIKAEVGSGSYGRKDTYTTVIRDEIAKTTTTMTDINNGSVEHTSICKTEYDDGKTEELKTVTLGGEITYSATTTTETHYTGGSQGGAKHTLTTTVNNLTGEKTVENHTIASNKNGTTETKTITKYDADGNIIETKTYKDGQEVVPEEPSNDAETEETSAQSSTPTINLEEWTDNGDGTYSYTDPYDGKVYKMEVDGDTVIIRQGANWTKYENGVPVKAELYGFDRNVKIDEETGFIYATHFGSNLYMLEYNEQGLLVEKEHVYDPDTQKSWYPVSVNGNEITYQDVHGNTRTGTKYGNGSIVLSNEITPAPQPKKETHEQQEETIRIRRTDYHYCSICNHLWEI